MIDHPQRDLALETVDLLTDFTGDLIRECRELGGHSGEKLDFHRLIDGVSTVTEGVTQLKVFIQQGTSGQAPEEWETIDTLESDLLSLLTHLLKAQETGNQQVRSHLLAEDLPEHFAKWQSLGFPKLAELL
jgi:hypothetical protein